MNDRTIIIENVSSQMVALVDIQNRVYGLQPNQKIRVSKLTVQDILDMPGNKKIFDKGLTKISNASKAELFSLGLTEAEIYQYADIEEEEVPTPVIVITDSIVETPVQEEEIEVFKSTPVIEVAETPTVETKEIKEAKPKTTKAPSKTSSKSKQASKK